MAVYDDEQKKSKDYWKDDGQATAADLKKSESTNDGVKNTAASDSEGEEQSSLNKSGFYSGDDEGETLRERATSRIKGLLGGSKKKKMTIAGLMVGGIGGGAIAGLLGLFSFLNVFQLDHLLQNIDSKAFLRYQVNLDVRSRRWVQAYVQARMADIGDGTPGDGDNLLFRANKVDIGNPIRDWYRTMRTSNFEKELKDKHGIEFTSVAYREGNQIKFKSGVIKTPTESITVDVGGGSIPDSDVGFKSQKLNDVTSKIDKSVMEVFSSDKEARRAIKKAVNENTRWYQVMKRFYLRKSIQNMTGVRDWRFFDKTRTKIDEKKINMRNAIIKKALPESTKSGKFIQCMFGITDCKGGTDPIDPENRATISSPEKIDCKENPTNIKCKTLNEERDKDGNTKSQSATGEAADGLGSSMTDVVTDEALEEIGEEGAQSFAKDFTKKIIDKFAKLNAATGVLDIINTVYNVHQSLTTGALSSLVYMARATQAIGMYTTFGMMRDQIKSGEVNPSQVNDAMQVVAGAGNSEAWDVINSKKTYINGVEAAGFTPASSRDDYCSAEHQAAIILPENRDAAAKEKALVCESQKISADSTAKTIENGYNNTLGKIISPIAWAYEHGPKQLNALIGSVSDAILGPVMDLVLKIPGLDTIQENISEVVGNLVGMLANMLGAGPIVSDQAPAGVFANYASMGASVSAEFAARNQGAAITNNESKQEAEKNVVAYLEEEADSQSLYERYASLDNPQSIASLALFDFANSGLRNVTIKTLNNFVSGSILAHASAEDKKPYGLAELTGVDTYDYPKTCLEQDPLQTSPSNATNADELGLINVNDLTWDLVTNQVAFSDKLYASSKDDVAKIKQVYNCALLDSSVRGSLGALYNDSVLKSDAYGR